MLKTRLNQFISSYVSSSKTYDFDNLFEKLQERYPNKEDPWGLNLVKARKILEGLYPFYKYYFDVRVFNKELVKKRPYIVVSNHSGQIAIDGTLITMAFATELSNPRVLRPMVERFFPKIPFLGMWASEAGAVLGDRQNCLKLLAQGESILAFPEGVDGVAKSTPDYYKLQHFSRGFMRMAIAAGVEILPVAVVGAEETFPWVYQAKGVAKALGLPALPISPHYFPLPSPIDIHIGKPYQIPEDVPLEANDKLIDIHVKKVKDQIATLISEGQKIKRDISDD